MEGLVLESAPWKCVEAAPPISFSLDGPMTIRPRVWHRHVSIATAEGRVLRADDETLTLVDGDDVSLRVSLPRAVDLGALVGQRVRITLRNEPLTSGPIGQLLTISDAEGRVKLIAHYGPAQGNAHDLGAVRLRLALSQRRGGPIVFGTAELQCVVNVGEHVTVRDASDAFVMHFVARTTAGYAAYVIVERSLWRG